MKLHSLFTDHAVLQQGIPVPIRGWDLPGQPVTVQVGAQKTNTTTGPDGRWQATLDPVTAGGPFEMEVRGSERIVVRDVRAGEVWLCSGQSNMQMHLQQCEGAEADIAAAHWDDVRFFSVPFEASLHPRENVGARWDVCAPQSASSFSATAFYFAKFLQEQIRVPIGLIHASSGDTPAEAWMSRESLEADPALAPIVERWKQMFGGKPRTAEVFEQFQKEWQHAMREASVRDGRWYRAMVQARRQGKPLTPRPPRPGGPANKQSPSLLYNAMIAPLIPCAMRGVIWYQGETNAIQGRSFQYRKLFRALIRSWRASWWLGDFPFLFVQLANHDDFQRELPRPGAWAELREAQTMALAEPNTAMAVAIDIGDPDWIHPPNKREVGRRLALAALARAYGRDVVTSGPMYESVRIEGHRARIRFAHVNGGLMAKGGELVGFELAAEDRVFLPARAAIESGTVVVWNETIPKPIAVRYAWADCPNGNLSNAAGLPASPFRTDDWPLITEQNA